MFTSGAATIFAADAAAAAAAGGWDDVVFSSSLESYPAPSNDAILRSLTLHECQLSPDESQSSW